MIIHIIHDRNRKDRYDLLQKEIEQEGLTVVYWPAIKSEKPLAGISLAHKQIVRYAKNQGLPFVCIAEDDLHFTASGAWIYFMENMPDDFDLYLASVYWGEILQPSNTVHCFSGMTLYVVHQKFYNTFLSMPGDKHIDRALKYSGNFVVCNPFAAIQHETQSDNNRGVLNNSKWMGKRKLFAGYENGKPKSISYAEYKNISVKGTESVQANP